MGYGSSHSYLAWMLVKFSMFVIASFVFSVIFWTTKHWLEGKSKKKK